MLSAAEKDIDSIRRFKEADFVVPVTSDEGNDDYLCFFSLKIVYCCKAETFIRTISQGSFK